MTDPTPTADPVPEVPNLAPVAGPTEPSTAPINVPDSTPQTTEPLATATSSTAGDPPASPVVVATPIINPTVGRVVHYRPGEDDVEVIARDGQPLAAVVVHVASDRIVNLIVFDSTGRVWKRPNVALLQGSDPLPVGTSYCEWMPYQKAVATGTVSPAQHAS